MKAGNKFKFKRFSQVTVRSSSYSDNWAFDKPRKFVKPEVAAKQCDIFLSFAPLSLETETETGTREKANYKKIKAAFNKIWKSQHHLRFAILFRKHDLPEIQKELARDLIFDWNLRHLLCYGTKSDPLWRYNKNERRFELSVTASSPNDVTRAIQFLDKTINARLKADDKLIKKYRDSNIHLLVQFTSAPSQWSEVVN